MRSLLCRYCKGNIITEPEVAGYIVDLKCLACGRSNGDYTRDELRHEVATPADVVRATTGSYGVWSRS